MFWFYVKEVEQKIVNYFVCTVSGMTQKLLAKKMVFIILMLNRNKQKQMFIFCFIFINQNKKPNKTLIFI